MADIFIKSRDGRIGFMYSQYRFHHADLSDKKKPCIHVFFVSDDRINVPYESLDAATAAMESLADQIDWAASEMKSREIAAAEAKRKKMEDE